MVALRAAFFRYPQKTGGGGGHFFASARVNRGNNRALLVAGFWLPLLVARGVV